MTVRAKVLRAADVSEPGIIDVGVFQGQDRRAGRNITREEFNSYAVNAREWRKNADRRFDAVDSRLGDGDKRLEQITTALFAKDDQNEHGQVGIMVTMRNIDNHIESVCKVFKWVASGAAAAAPVLVIGKTLGWI